MAVKGKLNRVATGIFKNEVISKSPKETIALGKKIARFLKKGDVVALFGDLGSGKTTLAQSIMKALGVKEHYILSPTFVLIREYEGKVKIFHFDFYRLNYLEELLSLGYEDYFYNTQAITIIEWAEKAESLLPENYLKIELFNSASRYLPEKSKKKNTTGNLKLPPWADEKFFSSEFNRLINITGVGSNIKKRLISPRKKR